MRDMAQLRLQVGGWDPVAAASASARWPDPAGRWSDGAQPLLPALPPAPVLPPHPRCSSVAPAPRALLCLPPALRTGFHLKHVASQTAFPGSLLAGPRWALSAFSVRFSFYFSLTFLLLPPFLPRPWYKELPRPLGSRGHPTRAPLGSILHAQAAGPVQPHLLCPLSPARGLSAGREPAAAQGPVSNVSLPRPGHPGPLPSPPGRPPAGRQRPLHCHHPEDR